MGIGDRSVEMHLEGGGRAVGRWRKGDPRSEGTHGSGERPFRSTLNKRCFHIKVALKSSEEAGVSPVGDRLHQEGMAN